MNYKFNSKLIALTLLITQVFAMPVWGASSSFNKLINYQAKLTDSSGAIVSDGDYNVIFKLYTASLGGTSLWTETHTSTTTPVTVTSGLFSVLLGNITSLSTFDFNRDLYLSISIGGSSTPSVWDSEMTPRKRIGAVPSAFVADTLDGLDSDALLRSDDPDTMASSSTSTLLTLAQTGTGGVLSITGPSAASFLTVLNNGMVGIGTSSPYSALSVVGSTGIVADHYAATGTATSTATNGWNVTGGCFAISGTCVGGSNLTGSGTSGHVTFWTGASSLSASSSLYWDNTNGRLGIGTNSPDSALKVIGNGMFYASNPSIAVRHNGGGGSSDRDIAFTYESVLDRAQLYSSIPGGAYKPLYLVGAPIVLNDPTISATNVGVGTTTPAQLLSVAGSGYITAGLGIGVATTTAGALEATGLGQFSRLSFTGATSTGANGWNITAGCFAISGTCAGGAGFTGSGVANRATFWTSATNLSYDDGFAWDNTNKRLGIGTSSPYTTLAVAGNVILDSNSITFASSSAASLTLNYGVSATSTIVSSKWYSWALATSTTAAPILVVDTIGPYATSTFSGNFVLDGGAFNHDAALGETSVTNLNLGPMAFEENAGWVSWINLPATTSSAAGTVQAFTAQLDSNDMFTIYGQADGSGGIRRRRVVIGSSTNAILSSDNFATDTLLIAGGALCTTPDQGTNCSGVALPEGSINSYGTTNFMSGRLGVGTTSPWARLSVAGVSSDNGRPLFSISSSSPSATTTVFHVDFSGNVGIGTTTPGMLFSVHGDTLVSGTTTSGKLVSTSSIQILGTATSTSAGGFDISSGCFAISGICVGGSGLTGSGVAGLPSVWTTATNLTSSSTLALNVGGTGTSTWPGGGVAFATTTGLTNDSTNFYWDNINKRLGIGTSSPYADLSVEMTSNKTAFVVADQGSTTPALYVAGSGFVGVGTNDPTRNFHSYASSTNQRITAVLGESYPLITTTGAYANYGQQGVVKATINSGVTNSSAHTGFQGVAYRDLSSDAGTLSIQRGVWSEVGHISTVNSSAVTTNAYGVQVSSYAGAGTVSNLYGFYLDPTSSGGTLTASYGAYLNPLVGVSTTTGLLVNTGDSWFNYNRGNYDFNVRGQTDDNLLYIDASANNVGIGTSSPYAKLSVVGASGVVADKFFATSSVATSTFMGGVLIGTSTPNNWKLVVQGGICITSGNACSPAVDVPGGLRVDTTGVSGDDPGDVFDIAELYPASEVMIAGEIASIDDNMTDKLMVRRAQVGDILVGVVSTAPAISINGSHVQLAPAREATSTRPLVALTGRVPVKVNLESGSIKRGDRIGLSSQAGVGKKVRIGEASVGFALENWEGNTSDDTVLVYVNLTDRGADQDFGGVAAIISTTGNWSIDAGGVLRVKEVHADRLCLGNTCVGESDLRQLLDKSGVNSSAQVPEPPIVDEPKPVMEAEPVSEIAPTSETIPPESPPVELTP